MEITVLIDNKDSWLHDYVSELSSSIELLGHNVHFEVRHTDVRSGDVLILLGCNRIFRSLSLNHKNLVVHESDLPKGRGMSPLTWQILEGKNEVKVTLLEADENMDEGLIYNQVSIRLDGTELVDDWRRLQFEATQDLILDFLKRYPNVPGFEQIGEPTYYRKRDFSDSELDVDLSLKSQFNHLRVVDNKRYPAWFQLNGEKYKLTIERLDDRF